MFFVSYFDLLSLAPVLFLAIFLFVSSILDELDFLCWVVCPFLLVV